MVVHNVDEARTGVGWVGLGWALGRAELVKRSTALSSFVYRDARAPTPRLCERALPDLQSWHAVFNMKRVHQYCGYSISTSRDGEH